MVKQLRLRAPIREDQTLLSYVGQLARINLQTSTEDFCQDMGTTLQKVAVGDPDAIKRIALVSATDEDVIDRAAFSAKGRSSTFRGQTVTLQVRAQKVRFCPDCLEEDVSRAKEEGARRPNLYAYGRPQWHISQYRTCVKHGIQLAMVDANRGLRRHDFARAALPLLDHLDDIASNLVRRPANAFERHLEDRILHGGNGAPVGLGFSVTARLCEMLGAVSLFGKWPAHLGFNDETWHRAGAAGFDIAAGGIDSILAFLSDLMGQDERDSRNGPHKDFGIIYRWLEATRDEEMEALVEPIRDHIEEHYPIEAGKQVLGRYVRQRRMHSITSASVQYGLLTSVLRPQLVAAGVVEDDRGKSDNHMLFPAAPNQLLLERLSRGISEMHARERINCERQNFPRLVSAGIISPIVTVKSGYPLFDTVDLDSLVERMFAEAVPYRTKPDHLETIATARMKCGCGQPEIVQLILDGKLKSVGRIETVPGYASVLVDPVEVAPLVRGEELGGITPTNIVPDLGVHHAGVVAMLDVHLPTVERMHPKRRCWHKVVDDAEYAAFKAKYVSLRDLAQEAGVHAKAMQAQLRNQGILHEPGFPPAVYLYLRSRLE